MNKRIEIITLISFVFGLFIGRFLQQHDLDLVAIIITTMLSSLAIGYLMAHIRNRL